MIVGAGLTGLSAAKHALEAGLEPIVLEKKAGLGGVWNPEDGNIWGSMTTNLSKYNVAYHDFPWEKDAPIFPNGKEFYEYI